MKYLERLIQKRSVPSSPILVKAQCEAHKGSIHTILQDKLTLVDNTTIIEGSADGEDYRVLKSRSNSMKTSAVSTVHRRRGSLFDPIGDAKSGQDCLNMLDIIVLSSSDTGSDSEPADTHEISATMAEEDDGTEVFENFQYGQRSLPRRRRRTATTLGRNSDSNASTLSYLRSELKEETEAPRRNSLGSLLALMSMDQKQREKVQSENKSLESAYFNGAARSARPKSPNNLTQTRRKSLRSHPLIR